MKRLPALSALIFALSVFAAAQTTEFTYQGKLTDTGAAAAAYNFTFRLCGSLAASCTTPTVELTNVPVSNGIFTVTLDFGNAQFNGADRFLEISVKRPTETNYTTLAPRQKITSVPYAIKSKSADTAVQLNGLDSSRYVQYDANGDVGIGTTSAGSKLTVAGIIESTSGGVKFPDASVQTTAGLTTVTTNSTLTGNGTTASPLGVTSPLTIRDKDNPALQPVQFSGVQIGGASSTTILTVPAGKRLVIETVSGNMNILNGQKFLALSVGTTGGGSASQLSHYFTPIFTGTQGSFDFYSFNHSVRIYADPQTNVVLSRNTTSSNVSVSVTISGYYVDLL